MTSRFQIQEMVSQDATRVVFLAEDESSGEKVALRRFIAAEKGESGEETREGFLAAIGTLSEIRHPSLRPVVEGGVDPVDGVPFVATEWVEGEVLGNLLENAVLSEADGLVMVFQALGLLEAVQAHSGTKANWLEFRPDDIIVRQAEEGPCFTFWATLSRWLGEQDAKEAVAELASLAGRCCGISAGGAPAESQLGEWLRYVRDNEPAVAEARGALKAIAQLEDKPSAPTRVLTRTPFPAASPPPAAATPPFPAVKQPSSSTGLFVTIGMVAVVCVIGLVVFLVVNNQDRPPEVAAVEESGEGAGPEAEAVGPAEVSPEPAPSPEPPGAVVREPKPVSPANDAIADRVNALMKERERIRNKTEFTAAEGEDIATKRGEIITVTGTVTEVRETTSYLYFEFGEEREAGDLCIRLAKESAPKMALADLKSHEGETLAFQGVSEIYGPWNRVCLLLESTEGISPVTGE